MDRGEFDILCNTCANNVSEGPEHAMWTFGQWVSQDMQEFWLLIDEVSKINPTRILEIGSSHGGGLIFWDRMVGSNGQVVSLDNNAVLHWTMDFSSCTASMGFIDMSSHSSEALDAVKTAFTGPVDFLFIDGDHSEAGARMDYEMYSPLVREGGIVGFHDISYDTLIQVNAFFKTIDKPKKRIEFTHGIGLVFL